MAKLRKWCAYKKSIERPYTRFSKYRKKAFVKARPGKKVIKFDMGDLTGGIEQFPLRLSLVSKDLTMVRSNAIEAARLVALRRLEKALGRNGFYFQIKMYPHHAIRENPLAAGAGADRLSTGMKHSFGKIIAVAARIHKGKILMEVAVPLEREELARTALKAASKKLPLKTSILTTIEEVKELTEKQVLEHKFSEAKYLLKEAVDSVEELKHKLEKTEKDSDKKKIEAEIATAESKVEQLKNILEIEKTNLQDFNDLN